MAELISGAMPPDDSGTDTFNRFRYQAHIAFRFCLNCYFEQGVLAITAEHFEDLLVESEHELRFVQIKTRNTERGPWKFRHLMDDGGALRSLLRTHRALRGLDDGRRLVYDIRLEGALERSDSIRRLAYGAHGADEAMSKACATRLVCDEAEAEDLLSRVVIHAPEPPREFIEDRNLSDLRRAAGHLSANELKSIYEATIGLIETAMRADLLNDNWPGAILEPESSILEVRRRADAKRVDRPRLRPILYRLDGSDHAFLSVVTDPDRLRATDLERKMLAVAASGVLIKRAKQLRANASRHMLEFRASTVLDVERFLADLEFRLLSVAETSAAAVGPGPMAIWRAIEERLELHADQYDPRQILNREPLLLMGAICQYSDECQFDWQANA